MKLTEFSHKLNGIFTLNEMNEIYPQVSEYGLWEEFIFSYNKANLIRCSCIFCVKKGRPLVGSTFFYVCVVKES